MAKCGSRYFEVLVKETFSLKVRVVSFDLSGYTAQCHFRKKLGQAYPDLALTIGSGVTISNPGDGEIDLEITADQTISLGEGEFFFDVRVEKDGKITSVLEGKLAVVEGATYYE